MLNVTFFTLFRKSIQHDYVTEIGAKASQRSATSVHPLMDWTNKRSSTTSDDAMEDKPKPKKDEVKYNINKLHTPNMYMDHHHYHHNQHQVKEVKKEVKKEEPVYDPLSALLGDPLSGILKGYIYFKL